MPFGKGKVPAALSKVKAGPPAAPAKKSKVALALAKTKAVDPIDK